MCSQEAVLGAAQVARWSNPWTLAHFPPPDPAQAQPALRNLNKPELVNPRVEQTNPHSGRVKQENRSIFKRSQERGKASTKSLTSYEVHARDTTNPGSQSILVRIRRLCYAALGALLPRPHVWKTANVSDGEVRMLPPEPLTWGGNKINSTCGRQVT